MDQDAASIFEKIAAGKDYAAFVGPEGGLTVKEEEIAQEFWERRGQIDENDFANRDSG